MPAVLLILGLVAAGLYSGAWGFYAAAIVLGGTYMIFMAAIAAAMKAAAEEIKKGSLRRR